MKKVLLFLAIFSFQFSVFNSIFAQAPASIPYQAVARGASGNLISNQLISIRFSVRDGSSSGTIVYQETQSATTNNLGLFVLNIGSGSVVSGTFSTINWGGGSKFMQVEIDTAGGSTFLNMGTQQFLSVPYALHAANGNWVSFGTDIYNQNAGNVGIGTSTPAFKLDVVGGDALINGNRIGKGNGSGNNESVIVGSGLNNNTTGFANTALGSPALPLNTTGESNTAIGHRALLSNSTGNNNTSVGVYSLYNANGESNVALGVRAAESTTSSYNTAIGTTALYNNTSGTNNTALGYNADVSVGTLTNATAIGANAIVSQSNSVVLGNGANVGIGTSTPSAKLDVVGSVKIADGTQGTNKALISDANGIATWTTLGSSQTNAWNLTGNAGTNSATNFIGTTDAQPLQMRVNNIRAGYIHPTNFNTGLGSSSFLSLNSGVGNTAIGESSLGLTTSGNSNTAIGRLALYSNVAGNNATAVGYQAMYYSNNTSAGFTNNSVAVGFEALRGSSTPGSNSGLALTAVGYQALRLNSSGNSNTAHGALALLNNSIGTGNTAVGVQSLAANTDGNYNTAIGSNANATRIGSILTTSVGYSAGPGADNLSNATAIGANAIVNTNNSLVLGNNANVGIGTSSPTAKLDVVGTVKIADGTQGAGKVLISNASGLASWTLPTSLTVTESDPQVSSLVSNQVPKWNGAALTDGIITDNGTNIGIGIPSPAAKLHVNGGIRMGSETGTSQAPGMSAATYTGMYIRRANSTSKSVGQIVATTDHTRLERDGTNGGWLVNRFGSDLSNSCQCTGITSTGTFVFVNLNTLASGITTVFTDAQNIVNINCTIGDFFDNNHTTNLELMRVTDDFYWVGTITSTFNQ